MNFYIASSFNNKELVRSLAKDLEKEGFHQTYNWTGNDRADSLDLLAEIGESEKKGVANSDFFVMILPGGKGSHVEMGIALGLSKRIYMYSPTNEIYEYDKTSTFYHIQGVNKFVGSFDSFKRFLLQNESIRLF
jgi:hypothetical protein